MKIIQILSLKKTYPYINIWLKFSHGKNIYLFIFNKISFLMKFIQEKVINKLI